MLLNNVPKWLITFERVHVWERHVLMEVTVCFYHDIKIPPGLGHQVWIDAHHWPRDSLPSHFSRKQKAISWKMKTRGGTASQRTTLTWQIHDSLPPSGPFLLGNGKQPRMDGVCMKWSQKDENTYPKNWERPKPVWVCVGSGISLPHWYITGPLI